MSFCGTHTKSHVVLGSRNQFNVRLYPKLVQAVCVIRTSMLDKYWSPGVSQNEKPRYQPVLD